MHAWHHAVYNNYNVINTGLHIMSFIKLISLAVRITGIFIILWAIRSGAAFIYTSLSAAADPWVWIPMTAYVMIFAVGIFMIVFPTAFSISLISESPKNSPQDGLQAHDLEQMAVVILGLYFMTQFILDASWLISYWVASQDQLFRGMSIWSRENVAIAATMTVELIVSAWFLFGSKGIVTGLRWLRSASMNKSDT